MDFPLRTIHFGVPPWLRKPHKPPSDIAWYYLYTMKHIDLPNMIRSLLRRLCVGTTAKMVGGRKTGLDLRVKHTSDIKTASG